MSALRKELIALPLVFQYGSNISPKRLNADDRLQKEAKPLGLANTIDDFELCFTHFSKENECATADLRPGVGRSIYGVLYDIPEDRVFREKGGGKRTLDHIEGEGTAYIRTEIAVILDGDQQNPINALTYLVKSPTENVKTCTSYVKHIIDGLREYSAPCDYLKYVKQQAAKNNPDIGTKLEHL